MNSIAAYLPIDRYHAVSRGMLLPERVNGAALFVDISGFTPLAAALADFLGPQRGVEELTRHLNQIYGTLITEVHRYGGTVICFSGDAVTCWFDADPFGVELPTGADAQETPAALAALRASASALAMQRAIQTCSTIPTSNGSTVQIGIKIGLAVGAARRFLVGQPYLDVVAGAIMDRVAAAERCAQPGELVASAEVVDLLGDRLQTGERRGEPPQRFVVIAGLAQEVAELAWAPLPDLELDLADAWLLPPIARRLQRGEGEFLAGLRQAVPLFLKFTSLDYDHDDRASAKLDMFIRWVQQVLRRYEGFLLEVVIGDKGCYLYVVFGALLAHEDDPARAVAAALTLLAPPAELGDIPDIQIGISQGQVYTGAYGGVQRRSHGVLGSDVNVAARLMGLARPGQILVTTRIAQAVHRSFIVEELGEHKLKGRSQPMMLYRVCGWLREAELPAVVSPVQMVGRARERALIGDLLSQLCSGRSSALVIEGEAGIGKSCLVADLLDQATKLGLSTLWGEGNAIESSTPYYIWRTIMLRVFRFNHYHPDLLDVKAHSGWREEVLARIQQHPKLIQLAPLLNAVLPLELPENDLTSQMSGELRADNLHRLLIALLQSFAGPQPLLLVLEDAHWLDSASWRLAELVRRDLEPLLLVIVQRPQDNSVLIPPAYEALLALPETRHLRLQALSQAEIVALIQHRLGVDALPPQVEALIYQKAEGHPFFSEEIAYALRDTGLISISNRRCQIVPSDTGFEHLDFPNTIQDVITSRIDHLPPSHQLMLKVASVIGRLFLYHILHDIYPIAEEQSKLIAYLSMLERLDITPLERPDPERTYLFKHAITQEVAYSMLLYRQRWMLHCSVAEWYERTYAADLSPFYPLLAHHWHQAAALKQDDPGLSEQALWYLEKAGEQALYSYANQEAVRFFSTALALDQSLRGAQAEVPLSPQLPPASRANQLRRARWERQLGLAFQALGKLSESRTHLEQALLLLGHGLPGGAQAQLRVLAAQIARQGLHRLGLVRRAPPRRAEELLEIARNCSALAPLYFVLNQLGLLLYVTFYGLNCSEQIEPSQELAQNYASMTVVTGMVGIPKLDRTYAALAQAVSQQLNHLSTQTFVLSRVSIYWQGQRGQAAQVRAACTQAMEIAARLGDWTRWRESLAIFMGLLISNGALEEFERAANDLYRSALRSQHLQHQVWAHSYLAWCFLHQGRIEQAFHAAEMALALLQEHQIADQGPLILARAMLISGMLHQGQLAQARQLSDELVLMLPASGRGIPSCRWGYISVLDVYLAQWQQEPGARVAARKISQSLRRFARTNASARTQAWRYLGACLWLEGKRRLARRAWQLSLQESSRFDEPYEHGLTHALIARYLPAADPARQHHLEQARALFVRLGAGLALALLNDAHPSV
jgi:class 3 adenylate cyclase/tetratricopeptide (TPR) repeat protein